MKKQQNVFLELIKFKITIAVTFTTILGYIMYAGRIDAGIILPTLGLFLIAAASAALNQYQEAGIDARMVRTSKRPIPSGRMTKNQVLLIILVLLFSGSAILYLSAGFVALQVGLLALIWYNGIYTPLKQKTPFAVIPGSVIGALPPVVGWVAAGGSVFSHEILLVAFFMFMWQIPHFWLLLMKHGDDYSQAGLPSLTAIYSQELLMKITFVWTVATAITALFLPIFKVVSHNSMAVFIFLSSLWLVVSFFRLFFSSNTEFNTVKYFIFINIFLLLIIVEVSIDSMI
jgi:protoheme IX farnesyltransferase